MAYQEMRRVYTTNAERLRAMRDKAQRSGGKVNGFTAEELGEAALHYTLLATANDADLADHLAASARETAQLLGSRGGNARAAALNADQRRAIARRAGQAPKRARVFVDAPDAVRCTASVRLGGADDTAQCGRRRVVGTLCTQHARLAAVR